DEQGRLGHIADDAPHQGLQGEDQADIESYQQDGQAAIHQRAIDEHIDIKQARTEHGNADGKRNEEQEEVNKAITDQDSDDTQVKAQLESHCDQEEKAHK